MLRAAVHHDLYHHAAAAAARSARTIDVMGFHQAPFPARTPILVKIAIGIPLVLIWVLPPIGVMQPDAVSRLIVLLLEGIEEALYRVFFGPIVIPPGQAHNHQAEDHDGDDTNAAAAFPVRVVFRSIQQAHSYLA